MASAAGDYNLQAENLNNLGLLETENGEIRKGIELQHKARELARQAGNRYYEGIILNGLARAYDQLAEPQKALKLYEQALELARDSADPKGQINYLNNIGDMYRTLGDWEKALDCFQRAAELSRSSEDHVLQRQDPDQPGPCLPPPPGAEWRKPGAPWRRPWLKGAASPHPRSVQAFALVNLAALELEAQRPGRSREARPRGRGPRALARRGDPVPLRSGRSPLEQRRSSLGAGGAGKGARPCP